MLAPSKAPSLGRLPPIDGSQLTFRDPGRPFAISVRARLLRCRCIQPYEFCASFCGLGFSARPRVAVPQPEVDLSLPWKRFLGDFEFTNGTCGISCVQPQASS